MLGSCTSVLLADGAILLDPCVEEERDAQAVVTLAFQLRQCADGTQDRQLLLSHMRGALSAASKHDVLQHISAEAAGCATTFMRTTLTRQVQQLHEQPERGARAGRVDDLIAEVKSRTAAA